jgi:hypothetical protein
MNELNAPEWIHALYDFRGVPDYSDVFAALGLDQQLPERISSMSGGNKRIGSIFRKVRSQFVTLRLLFDDSSRVTAEIDSDNFATARVRERISRNCRRSSSCCEFGGRTWPPRRHSERFDVLVSDVDAES